ncbi:MAG: anti-sigma factor [Methylophaga sp.]|nr:MAG: anti-sigma factor [Methylophaga sp.]
MTTDQNILLSALVDGELQGEELDQVLQLLATSAQAKIQLERYQLSSDVLHGYGSGNQQQDLTTRLSAALADEVQYTKTLERKETSQLISFPQQFWKQTAGLAIAASVGALAVVGVMTQPQNQLVPMASIAAIDDSVETMMVAQASDRWTVDEQEVEERLNTYLLDHNEYTSASGVFSYARVVSYGSGQ